MQGQAIFVISVITLITTVVTEHLPFYRKDYTFLEEFDAFYKLHWLKDQVGIPWTLAFKTCDDEGAQLFYPKEKDEWMVVKNLSTMLSDPPNITDVLIGIHDEIGFGEFVTVDGQTTPTPLQVTEEGGDCVIMDLQTGVFKTEHCSIDLNPPKRLFACKKIDEKPCPTIDLGYKFNKETKKCYKISTRAKTWAEAYHTCYMEGGLLLSPENNVEAKIIYDMIDDTEYFSGFHRHESGGDFFTVKGKKLEMSYNVWYDRTKSGKEDCGGFFKYNSLQLKTRSCNVKLRFICEMKAKIF